MGVSIQKPGFKADAGIRVIVNARFVLMWQPEFYNLKNNNIIFFMVFPIPPGAGKSLL